MYENVKPGAQPTEGTEFILFIYLFFNYYYFFILGSEGKKIAQCYLYVTIHNQVVPEASVSCVLLYLFTLLALLPFPSDPVPSLPWVVHQALIIYHGKYI
jgi:hypothetical protein